MTLTAVALNDASTALVRDRTQHLWFWCGLLTLAGSVIGLAGVQYLLPAVFDNPPGVSHTGLLYFRQAIAAAELTAVGPAAFAWAFRLLLAAAWVGYGTMLVASYRSATDLGRLTVPLIGAMAIAMAILFPPSLSSDIYAYAGWGRMLVMHGWSPYAHSLASLADINDPAGLIAPVAATSTHGPVWIALVSATVALLSGVDLWWQILALKVLAALALIAAAVGGREVARSYDAGRSSLTALAIGLNPLFLIEGPGNGHNDVLMIALMVAGIALCQKERPRAGYLLVGLSIGIKFVSAAIVPWLILEQIRRHRRQPWLGQAVLAVVLSLTPTILGYLAFGAQTNPLAGIGTVFARQVAADDTTATASVATGTNQSTSSRSGALPRVTLLLAVYAALTLMVWRSAVPGRYLSCWALFSLTLVVIGAPVPFAWYMIWPFSVAVLRWDNYARVVTATCVVLSVFLLAQYTVLYAR
jgi:alpha-1,6-mannosyltransferase